jgi:hypothetical protein
MLDFLGDEANHRKLRLFACALGRRLGDHFDQEADHHAVEIAEQVGEGHVPYEEFLILSRGGARSSETGTFSLAVRGWGE